VLTFGTSSSQFSEELYMANASQKLRLEKDSIGPKEIPADVYYGIQTARAVENYPISGMQAHPTLVRALGMVKRAAAEANKDLGRWMTNARMPSFRQPRK
jgi:aspartate ammonia-lyase